MFGEKMEVRKFVSPDNSEVRTTMIDGGPWFSAGDLCVALGISDMRQAVERLDDDERGVFTVPTPGGDQSIRAVSESGMYSLVLTSRKPEAKIFKKWVTAEVLPAIRKTGAYHHIPRTYAEALQLCADQARTIEANAMQIEAAKPAVEFVAKFVDNTTTQPLRAVAKVLKVNERAFVAKLIEEGILYRLAGKLTPAAQHMDAGRFEVKEVVAKNDYATTQMRFTTKGVEWIASKVQGWDLGKPGR